MIDAKTGNVLGTIDLGGTPEEGVADGKGMLYVVMQDMPGSVTAVDVKTMKAVAHYPFRRQRPVQRAGAGCQRTRCFSRRARSRGIRRLSRHSP